MLTVRNDLTVNIRDAKCSPNKPWIPVVQRRHAVVDVCHAGRSVCDAKHRSIVACRGMPHADCNPVSYAVVRQRVIGIMLWA